MLCDTLDSFFTFFYQLSSLSLKCGLRCFKLWPALKVMVSSLMKWSNNGIG
eukprot:m.44544 g.44544  ORF g.44544 m.44544 type:complete len:51 (+) comp13023_c0_seq3:1221-1373(+)